MAVSLHVARGQSSCGPASRHIILRSPAISLVSFLSSRHIFRIFQVPAIPYYLSNLSYLSSSRHIIFCFNQYSIHDKLHRLHFLLVPSKPLCIESNLRWVHCDNNSILQWAVTNDEAVNSARTVRNLRIAVMVMMATIIIHPL